MTDDQFAIVMTLLSIIAANTTKGLASVLFGVVSMIWAGSLIAGFIT